MPNEENKKEPCKLSAGECVSWSDSFFQCEIEQDACIKFDVDDPAQKEKMTKILDHSKKSLKAAELSASPYALSATDAGVTQILASDPAAVSQVDTQSLVAQPAYQISSPAAAQGIDTSVLVTAGVAAAGVTMMAVKLMKSASSSSKSKHDHRNRDSQQREEQRQECKSAAVNCAASTRALNERTDSLTRQIATLEEEIQTLSNPSAPGNQTSAKLKGAISRIDDLEEKIEAQEKLIKKLMNKLARQ